MEAVLLRDADILEQLGAVGSVAGTGEDWTGHAVPWLIRALCRCCDGRRKNCRGKLRLNAAKELAGPRVEFLKFLLARIEEEADGMLY